MDDERAPVKEKKIEIDGEKAHLRKDEKSKQTSLFLTQLQPQQNQYKVKTQMHKTEQSLKLSNQTINPVAEVCRKISKGP